MGDCGGTSGCAALCGNGNRADAHGGAAGGAGQLRKGRCLCAAVSELYVDPGDAGAAADRQAHGSARHCGACLAVCGHRAVRRVGDREGTAGLCADSGMLSEHPEGGERIISSRPCSKQLQRKVSCPDRKLSTQAYHIQVVYNQTMSI